MKVLIHCVKCKKNVLRTIPKEGVTFIVCQDCLDKEKKIKKIDENK